MIILQINVDRGGILLRETQSRYKVHLIMNSEPNKRVVSKNPWFLDNNIDAGRIVVDRSLKNTEIGKEDGFV